jgi:hypothetical protein
METWRWPYPYEAFGLIYLVAEYVTTREVFPVGSSVWHLAAFVRFVSVGLGLNSARLHVSGQVRRKLAAVDAVGLSVIDVKKELDK